MMLCMPGAIDPMRIGGAIIHEARAIAVDLHVWIVTSGWDVEYHYGHMTGECVIARCSISDVEGSPVSLWAVLAACTAMLASNGQMIWIVRDVIRDGQPSPFVEFNARALELAGFIVRGGFWRPCGREWVFLATKATQ